ncbi:uncharacterized protein [Clytia hemisphaerica]|uniref:Myb-like domain-containing protein n=1 Tax=Clytia hemisphaerica TaxID=252671 RepID=A0A7M5V8P6_9CNID
MKLTKQTIREGLRFSEMSQHSMITEQAINPYLSSRGTSNHMIQSMALGNHLADNNNSSNNNYFSEIQMDDGKWTRHQTQILIDTWKEHKDILLSTGSSSAEHFRVWKLIATEVNKFAPPKSLQQCKKKFRNIRYICKMAMNNNKQEGGKKHYPMFYSDFLEIISESERIKEGVKIESPNVEVLNDSSKDGDLYGTGYQNPSPQDSQYDERSSSELNTRREDELDERRTQQSGNVNNSEGSGSFNGSPQSRECENEYQTTTSPNHQPTVSETNVTNERREAVTESHHHSLQNGDLENGHSRINERLSNYYSHHDSMYPPIYSTSSEHYMRKHKNIDVSIMGRGYPSAKRVKRAMDIYSSPAPAPYKYASRHHHRGYPPTMATIASNSYPYHINNHYSTTPPLIRPVSTPKDTSPSPRNTVSSANNVAPSLSNDSSYMKAEHTHINDAPPALKSSPGYKNREMHAPKDLTLSETLNFYNQRFLDMQERQTELFSEMICRHEQFLSRLLEQQRTAAEDAQKRDKEFMLKLIEMFVKQ